MNIPKYSVVQIIFCNDPTDITKCHAQDHQTNLSGRQHATTICRITVFVKGWGLIATIKNYLKDILLILHYCMYCLVKKGNNCCKQMGGIPLSGHFYTVPTKFFTVSVCCEENRFWADQLTQQIAQAGQVALVTMPRLQPVRSVLVLYLGTCTYIYTKFTRL